MGSRDFYTKLDVGPTFSDPRMYHGELMYGTDSNSPIFWQLPLLADVLIKKSKQHRSAEGPTGILVLLVANFGP